MDWCSSHFLMREKRMSRDLHVQLCIKILCPYTFRYYLILASTPCHIISLCKFWDFCMANWVQWEESLRECIHPLLKSCVDYWTLPKMAPRPSFLGVLDTDQALCLSQWYDWYHLLSQGTFSSPPATSVSSFSFQSRHVVLTPQAFYRAHQKDYRRLYWLKDWNHITVVI